MKFNENIKPISYLKAHAADVADDVYENGNTYIITRNGEAKMALIDIKEYNILQQKLAFQKIIAISEEEIKKGKVTSLKDTFKELDKKIARLKKQWNTK